MPKKTKELGQDLALWMRSTHACTEERGRGRPKTDLYDLAITAAFKHIDGVPFEALASHIPAWVEAGYLTQPFHYNRLVEALQTEALTSVLDTMCLRVERYFRKIATVFCTDGVVFSTARTDNPRTSRFSPGTPVRITCHSQYELRFGLLTGFRLTWHARGRGSGEAPQYPYICNMTTRVFKPQLDLADGAFGTDRNFAFADQHGYRLLSPLNPATFKPETKTFLTAERAAFHLQECNVKSPGQLMTAAYPFRNRSEGWHAVVREQSKAYLISRPDRKNIPSLISLDTKKPDFAYRGLPIDQKDRDSLIEREQFVGRAPINEFHARRLGLHLRALVKASVYYEEAIDFFSDRCFQPRPEDEAFSVLRSPYAA